MSGSIRLAIAAVLLSTGLSWARADQVHAAPIDLAALVQQLGSGSFIERQRATRELTELGIAARDALQAAAIDSDAEVRTRARWILADIWQADFRQRLEAFAADTDGSGKQTLPGWEQFSAQMGGGLTARQLFVELHRAEPELMDAMAKGPKEASETLAARCHAIYEKTVAAHLNDPPLSMGTVTSLLWVASSPEVRLDEQLGVQIYTFLSPRVYQQHLRGGVWSSMLRKILGLWVVKDVAPSMTAQNLIFSVLYGLKAEGLEVAVKVLNDPGSTPTNRNFALMTVGRYGDEHHASAVEKLLADAMPCGTAQATKSPRQFELQVRDVALAVLVDLTGQQASDYGPLVGRNAQQTLFQVALVVFNDPALRDAALKKWAEWRAAHPGVS